MYSMFHQFINYSSFSFFTLVTVLLYICRSYQCNRVNSPCIFCN